MANNGIYVDGWPALMTTEMAARYFSMDEPCFFQLASRHQTPVIEIDDLGARWRKQDLDRLLKKLPASAPLQSANPGARLVRLEDKQVRAIADAVAQQLASNGPNSVPKLVSIKEACNILGIGRTTIYQMIKEEKLEARQIGRRTLIPMDQIQSIMRGEAGQPS